MISYAESMKKFLGIVVLGLLLTGCFATTKNYEAILDTWIGASEDHLVEKWGVPNGVYKKNDGGKILTFVSTGSMYMPGQNTSKTTSDPWGGTTTTVTSSSGTVIPLKCKTTFIISPSGKIKSWTWEGNDCTARK